MEKTRSRLRALRTTLPSLVIAVAIAAGLGASTATAAEAAPPPPATSAHVALATTTPAPVDPATFPFAFNGVLRSDGTPLEGVVITVTGGGFEGSATSGADGTWVVGVPAQGTYTVSLDEATLPDGVTLRDPSFASRSLDISGTTSLGVLFPFGAPAESGTGADPGTGSESGQPPATNGAPFFDQLLTRSISGLNFGLLLALAAIGITLVFGTTGLQNFAHGEMLTFGGILFFLFVKVLGLPFIVSVLLALLASAAFGWLHDAALFKPLRKRRLGMVQLLIVTIGLSIALRYFFQFAIGGGTHGTGVSTGAIVHLGPATLTTSDLVSMLVSIVVLAGVGLFLTRTRLGKATRAVSDNAGLAAASGIDVDRVIRLVWVIAGTLTGLAGILYTYFIGANVKWDMGFTVLLLIFASVTLGGLGSPFGALVGALIVGLVTEISTIWIPSDLRYAVALIILILVLLFRPQGVLGRKERIG